MLRTVTFSDGAVADTVNDRFVAAWHNRAPGFRNLNYDTEKRIFEHSVDAYPTKNICTFFLTPDGTVFYYVAGHLGPTRFLETLKLAARLREAGFDGRMAVKPDGLGAMRKIHDERASALKTEKPKEESGTLTYRGVEHRHGPNCRRALEALTYYLRGLHEHWSKAAELPGLEVVRYDYLYGNSFTEEREGASPIKGQALERVFG